MGVGNFFKLSLFLLGVAVPCFGKGASTGKKYFLSLALDYSYTNSAADNVAGAAYEKKYANPTVGSVAAGFFLTRDVYLGVRYEYLYSERIFSVGGISQRDILNYQFGGIESGYFLEANPRMFWLFTLGVSYPLQIRVRATTPSGTVDYKGIPRHPSFEGRIHMGFRLNETCQLLFHGGYRTAQLGNLVDSTQSYLPSNAALDLSGAFLGLSFGFQF